MWDMRYKVDIPHYALLKSMSSSLQNLAFHWTTVSNLGRTSPPQIPNEEVGSHIVSPHNRVAYLSILLAVISTQCLSNLNFLFPSEALLTLLLQYLVHKSIVPTRATARSRTSTNTYTVPYLAHYYKVDQTTFLYTPISSAGNQDCPLSRTNRRRARTARNQTLATRSHPAKAHRIDPGTKDCNQSQYTPRRGPIFLQHSRRAHSTRARRRRA
mmetsp:Transcript_1891/g.7040  ORF Transcript_1891/g.7040 Transcript_1891/m.7040 type:complete len:213 (-) Transcript_1891:154-792(-)